MTVKLFMQAIGKFFLGVLAVGLLLFIPAGTLHYPHGWLLMAILFIPMFFAGIVLMCKNPALLASRLNAKEKAAGQGTLVKLSGLMFVLGFVSAGLDFRFSLFPLPDAVSYTAAAVFMAAYLLYAEVLRENAYLSRTVQVQENQKVIDTGLYGIVRHPMYSATILLFLAMPLVLGSLISLLFFLPYPLLIAQRIRGEEKFLCENLPGYTQYITKVRYRLLPFVW